MNPDALSHFAGSRVGGAEKRVSDQFPEVATGVAPSKRTSVEL